MRAGAEGALRDHEQGERAPCFKRFLLGGPVCADGCRKCQKADGKGDEPSRARARAKLASLTASNAIEPGVLAEIKAGESGRA